MLRKCEVEVHRQARYRVRRGSGDLTASAHASTRALAYIRAGELEAGSWALYAREASWASWIYAREDELEKFRWVPPKKKKDFQWWMQNTIVSNI